MQICLFSNFPFTPKHRNAVSRARHRGRVAYNANERKERKIYTKKVISLAIFVMFAATRSQLNEQQKEQKIVLKK